MPVAIDTDFATYMARRAVYLKERLSEIHALLKQERLDDVQIKTGRLSISPHRGIQIPDAAKHFTEQV
jgi:hypothetical protein